MIQRPILSRAKVLLTALACFTATLSAGCSWSYRLDAQPPGFADVDIYGDGQRAKAHDNVGLNIRTFNNVDGGTLTYWAEDLTTKLSKRGYQLQTQRAVVSKNGVQGTRFDFDYTPAGHPEAGGVFPQKFYTVLLFVSDKWRVVVQVAGNKDRQVTHVAQVDQIAKTIKIGGCKLSSNICDGSQPPNTSSPPPAASSLPTVSPPPAVSPPATVSSPAPETQ